MTSLRTIPDHYLMCREIGHQWDWINDWYLLISESGIPLVEKVEFHCLRCKAERFQKRKVPGMEIVSTTYKHPEGYLLDEDGFVLKIDVRREHYRRRLNRRRDG